MPSAFPDGTITDWKLWRVELGEDSQWEAAHLAAPPEFTHEARLEWRDGLVADARGGASFLLTPDAIDPLSLARRVAAANPSARIRLFRVPPTEGEFEPLLLWDGEVNEVALGSDRTIGIRATQSLPGTMVLMCRDLSELPGFATTAHATWLPQVFGRCRHVRPVLLRAPMDRNRILGELAHDATVVRLREGVDWPAPGAVQVADEVIFYETIEGGNQLGDTEHPVTRFTARDHPDRAEVWRLDPEGIAWIVCDHEADVLSVTAAAEPDGPAIDGLTVASEDFHGREATLLRALIMPTERTEGSVAVIRDALFGASGNWQLTPSSTALRGTRGFEDWGEAQGAILTSVLSVLEADWIGNLARKTWRHDRIERALLAFELTPHHGWDADTELHVTVTRDGESIAKTFSLAEDLGDLIGLLEEGHLALDTPDQRPWFFDTADGTAGWSDSLRAIDIHADVSHAIGVRSGSNETLELRCLRPWPDAVESTAKLRVVFRAASPDGAKCRVRLTDDDEIDAESDSFVPGSDPETLEYELDLPSPMNARALLATLRAEVVITLDGTIELHEVWLDVGVISPSPTAALEVRASQRQLIVDVTPLLDDPFGWNMFDGDTPRVRVRFELDGAPPYAPATIARAHWRFETHPATVRPTAEIMATVVGRLTGEDGTAAPITVIRDLIEHVDFAATPVLAGAEAAWAEAGVALTTRGIGFRAIFDRRCTVADALGAACGESATLMTYGASGWIPRVLPLVPEIAPQAIVPDADCGFAATAIEATTGETPAPRVLVASNQTGHAWTALDPNAKGTARARWVDVGGDATLRAASAWCGIGRVRVRREARPHESRFLIGRAIAFPDGITGIVEAFHHRAGRIELIVNALNPLETLWAEGSWRISHAPIRGAVLITHADKLVAEIDATGNFLSTGALIINVMAAPGTAPVEIGDAGTLVMTTREGTDTSVLRIAVDGEVVLSHEITTIPAPAAAAGPVWTTTAEAVRARPDGRTARWNLVPGGLQITGNGLFERGLGG